MSKVKILYVEDEPFLAKIVKESLESRNYEVRLVTDGLKAIGAFKQFSPEICVLDVMLPNQNGYEIAENIRKTDPKVPIIFLTAKDQTSDLINGFSVGGNDYIRKPFSMEELIVRINNLLKMTLSKESWSPSTESVEFGSFVFYPAEMELHCGKQIKRLSHRESEILILLCQNQNQSVERKDILLKVWGDDSYFNSRNLDVYIRKLRNYLVSDDSVQILTLKGFGYRFIVH